MTTRAASAALLAMCFAASPIAAQSSATVPNLKGPSSGDVVAPIAIAPADGVSSLVLVLAYDPSIVTPSAAYTTGLTADYTLVPVLRPPDEIQLTLTGPVLQGSGDVAWVSFVVHASAGTSTPLTWRGCVLNDDLVSCDTHDGRIDVVSAAVTVHLPDDAHGEPAEIVSIPIVATDFTVVESIDLTLRYDPEVLDAIGVSETALTSPLTSVSNVSEPGVVRISFFGTTSISGSGALADVTFEVVGELGDATPLDLTKALFNEGTPSTVIDDGAFLVCSSIDGDGDLQTSCEGDCDDGNPLIHPGAAEVCDGADNDCNGWVDDVPVPVDRPSVYLAKSDATAVLSWSLVTLASGYDVIRGGIGLLRQTDGDFSIAADTCLADDQASLTIEDADPVAVGDGYWYLVRAANCGGAGTYDNGTTSQEPGRDAEIASAPGSCP